MAQFVFLYRRGVSAPSSPAQMQQTMQKWQAWFQELSAKGALKDRGLPLDPTTGKQVGGPKKSITDGPYAEKDLVMGFSLVEAPGIEQACELSRGCPIHDSGGLVEVRPVLAM